MQKTYNQNYNNIKTYTKSVDHGEIISPKNYIQGMIFSPFINQQYISDLLEQIEPKITQVIYTQNKLSVPYPLIQISVNNIQRCRLYIIYCTCGLCNNKNIDNNIKFTVFITPNGSIGTLSLQKIYSNDRVNLQMKGSYLKTNPPAIILAYLRSYAIISPKMQSPPMKILQFNNVEKIKYSWKLGEEASGVLLFMVHKGIVLEWQLVMDENQNIKDQKNNISYKKNNVEKEKIERKYNKQNINDKNTDMNIDIFFNTNNIKLDNDIKSKMQNIEHSVEEISITPILNTKRSTESKEKMEIIQKFDPNAW
ncbi:MAG: hypothetical protein GY928_14340 [Colwellia sp.]|nr:hypothetical protein [Colwellia sp.]